MIRSLDLQIFNNSSSKVIGTDSDPSSLVIVTICPVKDANCDANLPGNVIVECELNKWLLLLALPLRCNWLDSEFLESSIRPEDVKTPDCATRERTSDVTILLLLTRDGSSEPKIDVSTPSLSSEDSSGLCLVLRRGEIA